MADAPVNRVFVMPSDDAEPQDYVSGWGEGDAPEFVLDEAISALLGQPTFRLADPEAFVGRQADSTSCWSSLDSCGFTLGEPDHVAPSTPQVSELEVILHARDRDRLTDCENYESMIFDVQTSDERIETVELRLAAYIAADEDTLAETTEPALVWQPWSDPSLVPEIDITLGGGGDHSRGGEHFRRAGRYCFALTAIDMAGNESERSKPECIDTTDRRDPRVNVERGCRCTVRGTSGSLWPWLIAPLLIVWRRRQSREVDIGRTA